MPKTSCFAAYCPNPINFDTYEGCEHRCSYCFTLFRHPGKRGKFVHIGRGETVAALKSWIEGKRGAREKWASWRIPICWGHNSDPFQPKERETGWSLECLRVLAESKYPFVVTTKSTLIAEEPYKSLFAQCNCVLQMSMVCPAYDRLEKGAPPYEKRLECAAEMAKVVPRVIARWQPMFLEMRRDFNIADGTRGEFARLRDAGIYGVAVGMPKLLKKMMPFLIYKYGRYYSYAPNVRDAAYLRIREKCHEHGLVFLSGDSPRLSDSLECCGTEGLGWEPNLCTVTRHFLAPETYAERPSQREPGTGCAFKNVECRACIDTFSKGSYAAHLRTLWDERNRSLILRGFCGRRGASARKGGD